jgi:hypothetical protein
MFTLFNDKMFIYGIASHEDDKEYPVFWAFLACESRIGYDECHEHIKSRFGKHFYLISDFHENPFAVGHGDDIYVKIWLSDYSVGIDNIFTKSRQDRKKESGHDRRGGSLNSPPLRVREEFIINFDKLCHSSLPELPYFG